MQIRYLLTEMEGMIAAKLHDSTATGVGDVIEADWAFEGGGRRRRSHLRWDKQHHTATESEWGERDGELAKERAKIAKRSNL